MRIGGKLLGTLVLAGLSNSLEGQTGFKAPESPGVAITGDFNGDGCDNLVLFGYKDVAATYYGSKKLPHLVKGTAWQHGTTIGLCDMPVFAGGHLWVPQITQGTGAGIIDIYRHESVQKGWKWIGQTNMPIQKAAVVSSLKITHLGRDIDNDKKPDLFVAWGEFPPNGGSPAFHTAELAPKGLQSKLDIPLTKYMHKKTVVADLHKSWSVTKNAKEFLVILSAPYNSWGGFGFVTVLAGSKVTANQWAVGAPPLVNAGLSPGLPASTYGNFGHLPQLGAPLLKLHTGQALLFKPWLKPPFVRYDFELLEIQQQDQLFHSATVDYDGDGLDEIVLAELSNNYQPARVYIGDPSRKRAYAQGFELWTDRKHTSPYIYHAACGDFDGDGDPDMVVSWSRGENKVEVGYLAFFCANNKNGKGKPALHRIH